MWCLNLTQNSPISKTDLNLPHTQPQEESELETKLLPGPHLRRFLPSWTFGTLSSDLLSLISCVSWGKLLNLSEPHLPQKTDFVFHDQKCIPPENRTDREETQAGLLGLQRHGTGWC